MSKKKTNVALFCETQCSDGEDDEDYIDRLIKSKGPDALNSLLRDSNQDCSENEEDKDELAELRDSLLPLSQMGQSALLSKQSSSDHNSDG